jgi:hypothetical protein
MKRQWRIRRHFRVAADGAQRWDQAYQHLLEWAPQSSPRNGVSLLAPPPAPVQEEDHEHGNLCSRVDRAAEPSPNH